MIFWQIESLLSKYDLNLKTPICEIPGDAMQEILYGSLENVKIEKEKCIPLPTISAPTMASSTTCRR